MKVLMISGDRHLLEEGSAAQARLELQRSQVEELDVVVWPQVHSVWQVCNAARRGHYDVITAQDPFWRGHLAHHLSQLFGAKLNIQVHTDLDALSAFRQFTALYHLRRAHSVRVVSEKIKSYLLGKGVKAPISVLPVYIDLVPFKNSSHRPHPRFTKTILWIGRFEPEKNPFAALEILTQVRAAGIDAGLIMLGNGSLEAKLQAQAKEIAAHVEFPGWQSSAAYLAMANVVICTSLHESYGASMVEALAAGVPVVAPDVGVAKEAGAIISTEDTMAEKVVEVLQSGVRGELKMPLLSEQEWAAHWKQTLV